ncbi:MAG: hypothetical protein MI924_22485, partial [Chloroflexales bacterium]|nr:hypothetical protein [Chloroflexales bacterium]
MDAIAPGVAEGFNLFWLAGNVGGFTVLDIAAGGAPLEVAVELDAVGRVDVDALHFAAQALALGQASHHLERITQDHAVGPVLVVPVELGLLDAGGDAVEVGEEIHLRGLGLAVGGLRCAARRQPLCTLHQVVDQRLGVYLLLDVERRRAHNQVAPVLLVLAAPDQLRVQVGVARIANLFRVLLFL